MIAKTQSELIEAIQSRQRQTVGSASRAGVLYHEIPFAGYESIVAQRTNCAERVELLSQHLSLQGKKVLDIGCNVGYFCFEFARLGASCWGIDYDENAIYVANSLKQIHEVEDVTFSYGALSTELIDTLLADAGRFDIVLLNSVTHWLLYNNLGSLNQVAHLLNKLYQGGTQTFVYEPSSSGRAYYPEMLTEAGVKRFFHALGVDSFSRVGQMVASNIDDERELWIGQRDLTKAAAAIEQSLDGWQPMEAFPPRGLTVVHHRRDKVCLRWEALFVKTVQPRNSVHNVLLRNEAAAVGQLAAETEQLPILIHTLEQNGRVYLFYAWFEGASLEDQWIRASDLVWIESQFRHYLNTLGRLGICHNDLRPANVLVDRGDQALIVIDHEHATSDSDCATKAATDAQPNGLTVSNPVDAQSLLLNPPETEEEKERLAEQFAKLGGAWRSPYGLGNHANDVFAFNKIVFGLKNRSLYRRSTMRHAKIQFLTYLKKRFSTVGTSKKNHD